MTWQLRREYEEVKEVKLTQNKQPNAVKSCMFTVSSHHGTNIGVILSDVLFFKMLQAFTWTLESKIIYDQDEENKGQSNRE